MVKAARPRLRIGTRGSALARWQANWVSDHLQALGVDVELVLITTQGDVRAGPLASFGGTGVFTKELQRALLDGSIDLAVHSLKDLPTDQPAGLLIAAVPVRESLADVLVSNVACTLDQLAPGSRVGTGSLRRRAQLLHWRPDLRVEEIRGNVDTRLRKMDEGRYEAIVLAEAGLKRLGLGYRIADRLAPPRMFPAVGQGALGIETRAGDGATRHWVVHLDDLAARAAVTAERAMLARLRAGCLAPVGAWGRIESGHLRLDAVVLSPEGHRRVTAGVEGNPSAAQELGVAAAELLLEQGARELIAAAHGT